MKFLSKRFISKTFTHKSHIKQDIKWALFRSECLFLGMFTNQKNIWKTFKYWIVFLATIFASHSKLDNSQTNFYYCEHPYQKFLRTLNKYHNVTAAVLQFYILFFRRLLSNGSLYFTNVLHPRSAQGLYQCVVSVNGLGTMVSRTAQLIVAGRAYFSCRKKVAMECAMCNEAKR